MQYLSKFKIVIPAIVAIIVSTLSLGSHATLAQTPPQHPAPAATTITATGPDGVTHTLTRKLIPASQLKPTARPSSTQAAPLLTNYAFYGYTSVVAYLYGWYDSTGHLYAVYGVGQAWISTGTGSGYLDVYVDRNGVQNGFGTGNYYRFYSNGFLVEQRAFVDTTLVWVYPGSCYYAYSEAVSYYQPPYQPYTYPQYNFDYSFTFCA